MAKTQNKVKRSAGQTAMRWLLRVALYGWVVTVIFPLYWMVATALKDSQEFMQGNVWGWPSSLFVVNFIDAWKEANMASYVGNTLLVVVIAVVLSALSVTTGSYVLAKYNFKFIHRIEKYYFFCMMIPGMLLLVPQYFVLDGFGGAIESFIQLFAPDFTMTVTDSLITLAIVYAFGGLPSGIYLMISFMRRVDNSFIEAAKIDGAGEWYIFAKVIVPFVKPIIFYDCLTKFMGTWNEYMTALTFLESDDKLTLSVGLQKLIDQFTYQSNYGAIFAGLLISLLPTLLLYILFQKQIQHGTDMSEGLK